MGRLTRTKERERERERERDENKYCKLSAIQNESDVEQFFVIEFLKDLGFTSDYVRTKKTVKQLPIGKGRKSKNYKPDYICYADKRQTKPLLIIDAKHPDENPERGLEDALLYTSVLRRKLKEPKPEQLCVGTNGHRTLVKHYDSDEIIIDIAFEEFEVGNKEFETFEERLKRESLAKAIKSDLQPFEFKKPSVSDLTSIFEACHNLIWRKEKIPPAEAFYKFAKVLFVKIRMDKEIHRRMEKESVSASDFAFSVRWIESLESKHPDPVNAVLFTDLRNNLEEEIRVGTKKRMFDIGEEIGLGASTIKETVRFLEHHDLYAIDEDLNGRMFETFLTAVIRGRSLGQFFTPRTVVKFMADMADLTVRGKKIPKILDACCGTAGFLIEAMARLTDSITNNRSLSDGEKERLITQVQNESLWGIEANETIARIARINMYLHRDGGSRIYKADSLDKDFYRDPNITGESKLNFDELRDAFLRDEYRFDIILTNPPFAMVYEARKKDEKRILSRYNLAIHPSTGKLRSSLKSSVMFLERYHDLLKDSGFLLTVIDDSLLNTTTSKFIRDWLKQNFLVRAIISLPKNCFVQAGSHAKTSILVLEKKARPSDDQPSVFMAKSGNVGHTDSGKPELDSNDLPSILAEWERFQKNGTIPTAERCFVVERKNMEDRLDVQWYDPEYAELYSVLTSRPHVRIGDLNPSLKYGGSIEADYKSDIPFLRIENLRRNSIDLSVLKYIPSAVYLQQVKALYLQQGDILIARSGTYVGLATSVPSGFEKFVYGSYIIRLRLKNQDMFLPKFLSIYLNSRFGQMQFDRLKTGSLQFNINQTQIRDVIIPKIGLPDQRKIIETFESQQKEIIRLTQTAQAEEDTLSHQIVEKIFSSAGIRRRIELRDFRGE